MSSHGRLAAIAGMVIAGLLDAPRLCAQSAAAGADMPSFEVASIKPNKSGDEFTTMAFPPGGRFTAINISLRNLIRLSYGTPPQLLPISQIVGGPNWMESDRYDIVAKAEADSGMEAGGPSPEMLLMVRALAADRFKLAMHSEVRELPVYSLVLARRDGKFGPQLRRSEADCAALRASRGRPAALPPGPPPPSGVRSPSGMRPTCGSNGSPGRMAGGGMTMSEFALDLSRGVNRIVVDRTGLSGQFDYRLEWTPDQLPPPIPRSSRPDAPPPPPPAPVDGPSIFTAVQEQLGLKLESTRGPVDVLVIDGAERPTAD